MRAGLRRHRISIQRRSDSLDGYGEATPTWSNLFSRICARVRDASQREYTANLQVQSDKSVNINIRDPRRPITEKDRIVWHSHDGDRIYDIKAILAGDNDGRELDIVCIEHR